MPIPVGSLAEARSSSLLGMHTCSEEEVANVYIGDSNATPLHQGQRQCCESSRKRTDGKCRLPRSQLLDG